MSRVLYDSNSPRPLRFRLARLGPPPHLRIESPTNASVKPSAYVCAEMNDPEDTEETEDLDDLDILHSTGRALGTDDYISSMSETVASDAITKQCI